MDVVSLTFTFGNNSAESEPICGEVALADFGHDPHSRDSLRGAVFPKNNTKIAHKISRSCDFRPHLIISWGMHEARHFKFDAVIDTEEY